MMKREMHILTLLIGLKVDQSVGHVIRFDILGSRTL